MHPHNSPDGSSHLHSPPISLQEDFVQHRQVSLSTPHLSGLTCGRSVAYCWGAGLVDVTIGLPHSCPRLGPPRKARLGWRALIGWMCPRSCRGKWGTTNRKPLISPLKYLRGAARTGEAAVIVPACWGPRLPGLTLMRHCVWNLDGRGN